MGHCRHCAASCRGGWEDGASSGFVGPHENTEGTTRWGGDRGCPMCAEAEGVASWLRMRAGLDVRGSDVLLFAADGITARP